MKLLCYAWREVSFSGYVALTHPISIYERVLAIRSLFVILNTGLVRYCFFGVQRRITLRNAERSPNLGCRLTCLGEGADLQVVAENSTAAEKDSQWHLLLAEHLLEVTHGCPRATVFPRNCAAGPRLLVSFLEISDCPIFRHPLAPH